MGSLLFENTKVFPELREWCEERKFTLIDCDLRWGVPKDSTTRTTICTCMEELDRCYEDNNDLPFFINILSERFARLPHFSVATSFCLWAGHKLCETAFHSHTSG
jgi:hypothetical protein